MESTYLTIEREVIHRRRWLNVLAAIRTRATWAMTVTLIYLTTVYLGFLTMIPWWLLVAANLLIVWAGARRGREHPVSLHNDLFRVDRAFRLSERLSTIYELRLRSGNTDFLMALYAQMKDLPKNITQALPMPKSERRSWVVLSGLTFASILFLGLWFSGVPTLQISHLLWSTSTDANATATLPEPPKTSSEPKLSELLKVPSTKDSSDSQESTNAPGESSPMNPSDSSCSEQEGLSKLSEEQISSTKCAEVSPGEASAPSPNDSGSLASSREEAQAVGQALSDLEKRLEQGELSPDQLKDQLERLAEDTSSQGVQDALQHAAESKDLQELKESLSKLQEQLEEEQADDSDSDGKANEGESSMQSSNTAPDGQGNSSQPEGNSSSTDQQTSDTGAQDQEDSQSGSPPGEGQGNPAESGDNSGTEASSQSASDSQGSPAQGSDAQGQVQTGGDAPGQAPGSGAQSPSEPSFLPINQNLLIHGANLPRDPTLLDRLLTQGVPVDLAGPQRDGMPILRLNLERVEALLELRDLPPNLRNLVRAYFLALTGER